jgi:hypothetical protein
VAARAQELHGRIVALLVMDETAEGEPEWSVLYGTVEFQEGSDAAVFVGQNRKGRIPLASEQLARARPVTEQLRTVFAPADFFIPMTIGSIPEGDDVSDYQRTGFKLPK